ncbi:DNA-methyltransferase [Chloroflexota bacterium]
MSKKGSVEIIHGDSYQFLQEYRGESFCATVTDPPYGVGIKGMDGKRWDNGFPHPDYWREILHHTEDNGWLVCFASSKSVHRSTLALEDAGWEIQDTMAWIRPYAIGKANGLKRGWEAIILASNGSPRTLNIDVARICGDGLPQWPSQDLPDNNRALDIKRGHPKNRKGTRAPSSVVVAAEHEGILGDSDRFFIVGRSPTRERGEYNTHPAVKPVSLMEHLLLLVNRPDGLILDPFAGSGSTLVAAKKLDIRCIGIEIDKDYYNITLHRLDSITSQAIETTP